VVVYGLGTNRTLSFAFELLASTADGLIQLQEGVPLLGHLEASEWNYHVYKALDADAVIEVDLSPLSGDPDVYVSRMSQLGDSSARVSEANAEWRSIHYGHDSLPIYLNGSEEMLGAYMIGIKTYTASEFTVTAFERTVLLDSKCTDSPTTNHRKQTHNALCL